MNKKTILEKRDITLDVSAPRRFFLNVFHYRYPQCNGGSSSVDKASAFYPLCCLTLLRTDGTEVKMATTANAVATLELPSMKLTRGGHEVESFLGENSSIHIYLETDSNL